MKLYQYFRRPDKDNNLRQAIYEKYPLYAVTTNKKHAKRFEASRLKGAFIRKITHVEQEQASEYINTHRGSYLTWYNLDTLQNMPNGGRKRVNIKVLMTDVEAEMINASVDNYEPFLEDANINPDIFKNSKYVDLGTIGYIMAYSLNPNSMSISKKQEDMDVPMYIDPEFDELRLYIEMIHDQINPESFDSIIKMKG